MGKLRFDGVKDLLGIILAGLALGAAQAGAENGPVNLISGQASQAHRSAQTSVKVFKYTDRSGVPSFSDRAPTNSHYEVVRYSLTCYACNVKSGVDWHNTPLHLDAFQGAISVHARNYGIDPALVRAVIHAESAFRPNARSRAGALGLMQLMPETAREMGVVDPLSPGENIQGGVRYLAWLLQKTNGDTLLATAAYNAGPGAVERHNGIPPYEETQTYVKRVRILHSRYKKALSEAV